MKLLATDYDGTFKTSIKNLNINVCAVNQFMQCGNKFAIITGRSFNQIKPEIDTYNITYDYLVCNNGLIIFDKDNRIINFNLLTLEDLNFIYNSLIAKKNIQNVTAYTYKNSTIILKEILEVHGEFKDKKSAKKYKKYFEREKQHLNCYQDKENLFIGTNITKADAVSFIQELEKIDKKDIYTVGDNANDLEMLERFNGYKMLNSSRNLLFKKLPVTKEVHTLTKKLIKSTK